MQAIVLFFADDESIVIHTAAKLGLVMKGYREVASSNGLLTCCNNVSSLNLVSPNEED